MKVILEGKKKDILKFLRSNRLAIKKFGMSYEIEKPKEVKAEDKPKLTAKEVAELIEKAETLEDLKAFEGDERQVVKAALKKRISELNA